MARNRSTTGRNNVPRRTPESIIQEYEMHAQNCGEDLGRFLAQSRIFWERAIRYGVSHYEGIIRLIGLLPNKWKTWAIQISRNYINDAVNGFPLFLGEVHFCLIVYRNVPQGTYPISGNLTPTRKTLLGEPSISCYTKWRRTRGRAGDTLRTTKVVAKSPSEKKTEQHSRKVRKRYRKDKAPMQEEENARDRVYVVPEKDSYEEWGARRTSGMSEDRYQPGDCSRLKIYVESDSENDSEEEPEEEHEEENKEKSKEKRNSPSDASTSSKYFL